jgi:hypothetical protein
MSQKQKKYHFIYKTTDTRNGNFYIGMHSTENLKDGYVGSGTRLKHLIYKHGKEIFNMEILEFLPNRESLKEREIEIVNSDLLLEEKCMNLKPGGYGGFNNKEHMMKTSRAGNEKFKKNLEDEEYRKEFSKKMSEINKKSFELGTRERKYFYDWTGKKHTNDTKLKLSLKNKNKGVGVDNSVWGRKWMNKGGENKMVKPEEFEFHLLDGWLFGIFIDEKKKSQLKERFEKIRHLSGPSCVGRKWINKNGINKRVVKEDLNKYLNDGWVLGCLIKKPI